MILVLIGFKGVGKTYFGQKLAEQLNLDFYDTDQMIEELYAKQTGQRLSVREICKKIGEAQFRKMETELVNSIEIDSGILSVGGGTLLNPQNVASLKKLGSFIYLKRLKRQIYTHLSKGPVPTFLNARDFDASFEKMYQMRAPIYEQYADYTVDASTFVENHILAKLAQIYKTAHFI